MRKKDVLDFVKGYATHGLMILDIYEDEEEVPDSLIELITKRPEPIEHRMYMGAALAEEYDKLLSMMFTIENENEK